MKNIKELVLNIEKISIRIDKSKILLNITLLLLLFICVSIILNNINSKKSYSNIGKSINVREKR